MRRMTCCLTAMATLLPLTTLAQTVRPDWCDRATTATERAICSDPVLAALDIEMASTYSRRLRGSAPEAVRADQRIWLDLRAACGTDAACLEGEYRARIAALAD